MTELDGIGIAAVFAADAELDVRADAAPALNAEAHHRTDAFLVDRRERIALHDFQADVVADERSGVVSAHAERRLRQVVRPEREEFRVFGDFVGRGAGARDFDHRADFVGDSDLVLRHHFGSDAAHDRRLILELGGESDERNHHFGRNADFFLHANRRRFEDRARLHFRDFRIGNAEAASAMPEHRVELVQLGDAPLDVLHGNVQLLREIELLLLRLREKFVQRRIQQTNRRGKPLEFAENPFEVAALIREQLVHGRAPPFQIRGENHFADGIDAVALEEHVLRARQPDALRAERHRDRRLRRRVRVRAHAEPRRFLAPRHQLREILVGGGRFRFGVPANDAENDVARRGRNLTEENFPRRAVDAEPFAFLDRVAADGKRAVGVVDVDARRAADADFSHLARDERRVGGNAAARRQNAFRGDHAAQVFRRRFQADEQNFFAVFRGGFGAIRVEVNFSGSRARPRGQPVRDRAQSLERGAVEDRREHLVELIGGNAAHGGLPVDQLFAHHFAGDADGGDAGALAVARLQHEDFRVLDRELEVLHVAEMVFQNAADGKQLFVRGRHHLGEVRHGIGRAHAGDDVLALRIHQKFSVENFLAARGIARERDAGAGPVARVPEDHRLHVHRRAPFRGNVIFLAVKNRAFVHPRAENGADRAFELLPRIRREVAARAILDELLEAKNEFPQLDDAELRIARVGLFEHFRLHGVNDGFERFVILIGKLLHAEHDVAVHLHEAAIAVPGEAFVLRHAGERFDGVVVQTEIQNRVHHAGHRFARARAHGDEQREPRRVSEFLSELFFDVADGGAHVRHQRFRIRLSVLVIICADVRADREAGRNRQPDAGHFRKIGAFPAKKIAHLRVSVSFFPEFVNELRLRDTRSFFGHV